MSNLFTPIKTADLVWRDGLPFSRTFEDIYFCKEDGLAQAKYVFIEGNQLIERWQNLTDNLFVIAETGFGSGLNFLLVWSLWLKYAPKSARLHFMSCEKHPLALTDLERCLRLWPQLQVQAEELRQNYPILTPGFHHLRFAQGRINLTLMLGEAISCFEQLLVCGDADLEPQLRTNWVDAWFLDGFSPAKNQAMWSMELFAIIALLSKSSTTLATFSAAALVKNNLQASGFTIKKIKGLGQKREIVIGKFQQLKPSNKKLRSTPWQATISARVTCKRAIVLGAGLAGCYTAHALAKRGWQVTLLDEQSQAGLGASANRQATLYPQLSAYRSPLTMFMLTAFLFASREYKQLLKHHPIGDLSGLLQFISHERERAKQACLKAWLCNYPSLGSIINAQQASQLAGIKLEKGGLFIAGSGWLDSQALCALLQQTPGVSWFPNTAIEQLIFNDGSWHVGEHIAEIVVIANGYQAKQFTQTAHLPLKAIRGQMSFLKSNRQSAKLKIPLCGEGHVLPEYTGLHAIGASYHLDSVDKTSYLADDLDNFAKLLKMPIEATWLPPIKKNWTGIRATTPDYLPLVGPVPDAAVFATRFASLATNAKRWIPNPGAYQPGLFLCTGFGSRGLATIPLCAEWLAGYINNEPDLIPHSMIQSLSPARFLLRKITKGTR